MPCWQAVRRTLRELMDLQNRLAALDIVIRQVSSCRSTCRAGHCQRQQPFFLVEELLRLYQSGNMITFDVHCT